MIYFTGVKRSVTLVPAPNMFLIDAIISAIYCYEPLKSVKRRILTLLKTEWNKKWKDKKGIESVLFHLSAWLYLKIKLRKEWWIHYSSRTLLHILIVITLSCYFYDFAYNYNSKDKTEKRQVLVVFNQKHTRGLP